MPIFTLRCDSCDIEDEVFVLPSEELELICAACGADLQKVLSNISIGGVAKKPGSGEKKKRLSCCGTPRCRCSVKLTKPNPFKSKLDATPTD